MAPAHQMYVRFEIAAHAFISFWNGAFDGSVSGAAKLHSISHRRMMTFGLGFVMLGAGRLH